MAPVTPAGGTISMLVGVVLLRLAVTGTYARYVRVGMGTWLIVAAVLVIALGVVTLARTLQDGFTADEDGHDHADGVWVGWLLLGPIVALLLVAPPTLGSYGVDRTTWIDVRAGGPVFAALPRSADPIDMSLIEFAQRAYDHRGATFNQATVRLTGFVAGAERGGFRLARYQIACCAADAAPVVVRVVGSTGFRTRDQWIRVTGTFHDGSGQLAELAATSIAEIPAPNDPYE